MKSKHINCLSCGANHGELIIDRETPRHYICYECGFVYMNPIPDYSENSDFYNNTYWQEHHQLTGLITEYPSIPRRDRIVNWTKPFLKPESRVLEIGCGFGFNLDYFKKQTGITPEGLEVSKEGQENTEKAFGIKCHHNTIENFESEFKYDVIIMSVVLEHFEDPQATLNAVYDLLNPNGIVWIEVPNIMFPHPTKNMTRWLSKEHISYFSPEKLSMMLTRAGFNKIHNENSYYICMMAKKGAAFDGTYPMVNEYKQVKKSIRRHELYYTVFKIFRKFNIILFKKYSIASNPVIKSEEA